MAQNIQHNVHNVYKKSSLFHRGRKAAFFLGLHAMMLMGCVRGSKSGNMRNLIVQQHEKLLEKHKTAAKAYSAQLDGLLEKVKWNQAAALDASENTGLKEVKYCKYLNLPDPDAIANEAIIYANALPQQEVPKKLKVQLIAQAVAIRKEVAYLRELELEEAKATCNAGRDSRETALHMDTVAKAKARLTQLAELVEKLKWNQAAVLDTAENTGFKDITYCKYLNVPDPDAMAREAIIYANTLPHEEVLKELKVQLIAQAVAIRKEVAYLRELELEEEKATCNVGMDSRETALHSVAEAAVAEEQVVEARLHETETGWTVWQLTPYVAVATPIAAAAAAAGYLLIK